MRGAMKTQRKVPIYFLVTATNELFLSLCFVSQLAQHALPTQVNAYEKSESMKIAALLRVRTSHAQACTRFSHTNAPPPPTHPFGPRPHACFLTAERGCQPHDTHEAATCRRRSCKCRATSEAAFHRRCLRINKKKHVYRIAAGGTQGSA